MMHLYNYDDLKGFVVKHDRMIRDILLMLQHEQMSKNLSKYEDHVITILDLVVHYKLLWQ
jgi:hypothetical protein